MSKDVINTMEVQQLPFQIPLQVLEPPTQQLREHIQSPLQQVLEAPTQQLREPVQSPLQQVLEPTIQSTTIPHVRNVLEEVELPTLRNLLARADTYHDFGYHASITRVQGSKCTIDNNNGKFNSNMLNKSENFYPNKVKKEKES